MTRTELSLHRRLLKLEMEKGGIKIRGKKPGSKKREFYTKQILKIK